MSGMIYKAAAGALLQQMRLNMLTNNLANVTTTGYKADMPVFRLPGSDKYPEGTQSPKGTAAAEHAG